METLISLALQNFTVDIPTIALGRPHTEFPDLLIFD